MWLTLFGAFGGAIVLLYLLRLRRRRMEVPFGALWQLVLAEKQTTSLFRVLRNLLSLLIQLTILALVLTAIADPNWTGDTTVSEATVRKEEQSHTLLVVDTSASMRGGDGALFADAQAAARKVVESTRPGERVMVVSFDRDTVPVTDWTRDRKTLREAVDALQPKDAANATDRLQDFAVNAVRGLENARVVLISDRRFDPLPADLVNYLNVSLVPVGPAEAQPNAAILGFSIRSHLGNRLRYALQYTLANLGSAPLTVKVHLYADPKGTAQSREDFMAGPPARAPFVHTLAAGETRSFEQLEVDLEGSRAMLRLEASGATDGLAVDDVAFAAVPARKSVRVQVVGTDNLFLRAALATRKAVEVTTVPAEAFSSTQGFDLTIFDGVSPAAPVKGNALYLNVGAGGTNLPVTPGKALTEVDEALVPPSAASHPVMAHVRFVDLKLEAAVELQRKRKQDVLARTKAGAALIVAGVTPEQRYVAVGFDPVGTGWVMHYSFSVFFVNAVNWFFSEESTLLRAESLTQAWSIRLPWAEGGGVRRADIRRPDGVVETALVDGAGGLAYTGEEVGIYAVSPSAASPAPSGAPAAPVLVPALLGSPEESRLEPRGDYGTWEAPAATPEELPAFEFRGLHLWQLLALAAAALLLLEWFTFHRRWTT